MFTVAHSPAPQQSTSFQYSPFSFSSPGGPVTSPPRYRSFAPLTPSPLRKSRNAHNLSAQHTEPNTPIPHFSSPMSNTENLSPSIFSKPDDNDSSSTVNGSTQLGNATSEFGAKSKNQSPQNLLSRATTAQASARRSLFFDRNRRSRDDRRFEARSEQAMRLDFVRERQEWEEKMRRRAELDVGPIPEPDEMMDDDIPTGGENWFEEMPPPEEEMTSPDSEWLDWMMDQERSGGETVTQSLEALPSQWQFHDQVQQQSQNQIQMGGGGGRIYHSDSEDEDYDQLFMDVMSQEAMSGSLPGTQQHQQQQQGEFAHEEDMEMS